MRTLSTIILVLFAAFAANGQSLSVMPLSRQEVYANDEVELSWVSDSSVNIDYSIDSGSKWLNIATDLSRETTSFDWTVPDIPTGDMILRFTSRDVVQMPLKIKNLTLDDTYYKWWKVSDSTPYYQRDGAGALVFKDKMWLIGGWNPNMHPVCNSEIWNSADGVNWNLVTVAPWEGRHTAGYVVFKNKMWVIAGDANSYHYQNEVWNTDDGVNWVKVTDSLPWMDRVLFYTTVFKDKIYVIGGQSMLSVSPSNFILDPLVLYSDVWSSTDGVNWTKELDSGPWLTRGLILGDAVLNGNMWLIGGGTYAQYVPRNFYNDVWKSEDGKNWVAADSSSPWAPREYHSTIAFDNKLWVIGGWGSTGNLDDTWYSANGQDWSEVTPSFIGPRHANSVFNFKNSIWLAGGSYNEIWRLIKKTNTLNLNHTADTLLYEGDSLYLRTDHIAGGNYNWQKDGEALSALNKNDITVKSSGKYRLVFTDLEGDSLSSPAVSISFVNKAIAPYKDTAVLWGDTTFNPLQIDSVDNASYEWFKDGSLITNATSHSYSVGSIGTYSAKVSLANQTPLETDSVRVTYFKPTIRSSTASLVLREYDMKLTTKALPSIKYQWYRNGVFIPSSNDTSLDISDIGTYNVLLTTPNGYSYSSDSAKISSGIINKATLDLKSASLNHGTLRFELFDNDHGRVKVMVIGMTGRILFEDEVVKSGVELSYSKYIPGLQTGDFVVEVTMNHKLGITKTFN